MYDQQQQQQQQQDQQQQQHRLRNETMTQNSHINFLFDGSGQNGTQIFQLLGLDIFCSKTTTRTKKFAPKNVGQTC